MSEQSKESDRAPMHRAATAISVLDIKRRINKTKLHRQTTIYQCAPPPPPSMLSFAQHLICRLLPARSHVNLISHQNGFSQPTLTPFSWDFLTRCNAVEGNGPGTTLQVLGIVDVY